MKSMISNRKLIKNAYDNRILGYFIPGKPFSDCGEKERNKCAHVTPTSKK